MRHRKKINHLGRKTGHRKAMLANMASSLILHKRISTTTAKAKALRSYVEPLITKTKNLTTRDESSNAQRVVFRYLQNKYAVKELFKEVGPKVTDRPGGYTRILKTGTRLGDNADMCIIELVDYNENLLAAKEETAKSTKRRRRGGKKSTSNQAEAKASQVIEKTENAKDENVAEIKEEATIDTAEVKKEVVPEETSEETPDVKSKDDSPDLKSEEGSDKEETKKE
jgi:large subunit ribosomal protein L17